MIDTKIFNNLYALYKPRFDIIATSYLRDRALAEDIVTDSFLTFWEKREDIQEEPKNFPRYILGIVRHKCIDELRRRTRDTDVKEQIKRSAELNLKTLENNDLPNLVFAKEVEAIYKKRLADMPELSSEIFQAHREDGLTYSEIASKYHLSTRQVTRKIQFCLRVLRTDLSDYLKMLLILKA